MNKIRLLVCFHLLFTLSLVSFWSKGQTALSDSTTLSFFISTANVMQNGDNIATLASFVGITRDSNISFNFSPQIKNLPGIKFSTRISARKIAYIPNYISTQIVIVDLLNTQNKIPSDNLPYVPSGLTSDGDRIFVYSSASNQIIKLNDQGKIDKDFNSTIPSNWGCIGLQCSGEVLYALFVDNLKGNSSNAKLYAINTLLGTIMGSVSVDRGSQFSVSGLNVVLSQTDRVGRNPEIDSTTIKIFKLTNNGNTVIFEKVGNDITQTLLGVTHYSMRDTLLYAIYRQGKMAKINLNTASIDTIVDLRAGLPQFSRPHRINVYNNYAIIIMNDDADNPNSQIVLTDLRNLSSPINVLQSHNLGRIRSILMLRPYQ